MSEPQSVEIGTAIVSYIEPHAGQAVAFNRWYERDHFPATVTGGPGVFAGARYVATRACKARRPAAATLFGDPARGSYLAVTWVLAGKQAEWEAWVAREMETIVARDRLFAGRDHVHTAVYRFVEQAGAVDACVALDRAFPGVIVLAGTARAGSQLDCAATVRLRSERTILSAAEPPDHDLVVGFCDADPCTVFDRSSIAVGASGFAGPFVATVPGTDRYTDDL